uniref:Cation/H+ exchanger transmembrane domain-containing protein n=1 Tax=Arundo donax TaxID=35708 RepID=A0A0A8XPD6_ARUDO
MIAHRFAALPGPAAIVIGSGLALSSTAVVLQVLQERGESTSRHGRATFSVLLFQDLAVVVLLILIPLISPNSSKGGVTIVSRALFVVCARIFSLSVQIVNVLDRLMSSSESSTAHNLKFVTSNYSARLGFSQMIRSSKIVEFLLMIAWFPLLWGTPKLLSFFLLNLQSFSTAVIGILHF